VKSTLISGNLALAGPQSHADGPDVAGMVIDQGFNFVGITNGSSGWHLSDFTGNADDPLTPHAGLGPLQYNGGPTPTMALLPSSWVVDQGQSSGVSTDQRGEPRTYDYLFLYFASPFGGDGTDIGAYEVQGPVVTSQPQSQFIAAGQNAVFTVSVNSPAGAPWYQWHKDFTDINGVGFSRIVDATNATYTRTNVQLADAGEYSVMIGDAYTPGIPFYGALRSSSAKLRVGYALNRSMVGGGIIVPSLDVPVYTNNSSVVLFASPAPGWIFSHWSGDTNGAQNPLPIVMATNRFITANFTSTVSACAVSPLGLVGWWPGEGNANDIIGTNNGTVQNGVAYAAGKVGQAFDLDGASADVYIPASPTLQFSTQFTIEAWVRPNDVATNRQILLLADPFEGFCLLEASTNGSVRLYVGGDSGGPTQTSDSLNSPAGLLSVGTWAHVAGSFHNGQLLLFVNGITVAAKLSRLFSIFALPPAGYIGGVTGSGHQRFFGSIDELSVYNRALGEAEIRAIYAAGDSGKCAPPCASSPAGLVSWWPGASTANDIAGANNGALQNGVAFATGQVGQAFSFDGVDDFVSVANTASMDFGVSDFSIDLWFKLNALASDQAFFHKSVGNVPGDQTYLLEFDTPNSLRFLVRGTSANQNDLTVPTSLAAGRWYHLAAVREGNTSSLYVNAALIGRQTAGASVDTGSGGTAAMGKLAPNGTGVNRFLRGYLDEVDLFNRALAQSEVQAIYNAGTLGKCLAPAFITSAIRSGNNLNINWLSKRGLTYRAQYKTNLDTITSWQDVVGDVTATNTTATKTDLLPASTFQRFYRVEMFR
jgi:hypothetical protein